MNDIPATEIIKAAGIGIAGACADGAGGDERRNAYAKVAHELRTPLAAIVSLADVMAGEHLGPLLHPQYRDYARSIAETARHTLDVIRGMLETEHLESMVPTQTFTELDLNRIVTEAIRAAGPMASAAGLAIRFVPAQQLPRVIADGVAMRQILLNVITNAIRYAGTGATLVFRTGVGAAGDVWLEAEDDGPGFPSHVLQGPEPAEREDAAGAAAPRIRFGLSLVRALAAANGGRVLLSNVDHSGARLRIIFDASRSVIV